MFWYQRTLGVLLSCVLAVPVCAFTFSYGSLLEVKDIEQKNGVLLLPLTGKKYTNVKVLSKTVYDFLQECSIDCTYPVLEKDFSIIESRVAANRPNMLIATVQFNQDILLTVLAFKERQKITIKFPAVVSFKDKELQAQVQKAVLEVAQKNL